MAFKPREVLEKDWVCQSQIRGKKLEHYGGYFHVTKSKEEVLEEVQMRRVGRGAGFNYDLEEPKDDVVEAFNFAICFRCILFIDESILKKSSLPVKMKKIEVKYDPKYALEADSEGPKYPGQKVIQKPAPSSVQAVGHG